MRKPPGEDMSPMVIDTNVGMLTSQRVLVGEEDTPPSELNVPELEES